jgi:deferrochelatase/peroxidase EfeB
MSALAWRIRRRKSCKDDALPNDSLDAALCHGDLLLQICANTQDTVIHALRDVIKHTPDLLSVRWKREGFISDSAARSKGKETPVNLLGFKDGTANPVSTDKALMDEVVWVTADQGEPAWAWAAAIRRRVLSSSTWSSGIARR